MKTKHFPYVLIFVAFVFSFLQLSPAFVRKIPRIATSEWSQLQNEVIGTQIPTTLESQQRDCWTAEVTLCSDTLFSAVVVYERYLGGITGYGIDSYTFDRRSGERLYLHDVIACGEEPVREAIVMGILEQYPDVLEIKNAY